MVVPPSMLPPYGQGYLVTLAIFSRLYKRRLLELFSHMFRTAKLVNWPVLRPYRQGGQWHVKTLQRIAAKLEFSVGSLNSHAKLIIGTIYGLGNHLCPQRVKLIVSITLLQSVTNLFSQLSISVSLYAYFPVIQYLYCNGVQ